MLRQEAFASACALMLLMGGCPKRQERQSVVVYVPTTPAAVAPKPDVSKPEVLVIEEPAPPPEPQPPEEKPQLPQVPKPGASRRRSVQGASGLVGRQARSGVIR